MSALARTGILILGLSLPLWAKVQSPPAPVGRSPGSAAAPATTDRQIWLDTVVTDRARKPAPGLVKQDFTVSDNKKPQKIVSFAGPGAGPETQVLLVVDTVNASFQAVSYEQQQLDKYFKQNGGRLALPESLVLFSDSGAKIFAAPSQNGSDLAKVLDQASHSLRTINRSQGFYGAADRLQLSLRALDGIIAYETQQPGRKLVVWIGPGWPILSGPAIMLSGKQQDDIFSSVTAIANALRQARVILYNAMPLGFGNLNRLLYYQTYLKPISKAGQAQEGNLALQVLAVNSGGLVLNSNTDLAAQVTTCAADAKAFYTLAFDSKPSDKQNDYHQIEVIVDKPGLKVRTRSGYYAEP